MKKYVFLFISLIFFAFFSGCKEIMAKSVYIEAEYYAIENNNSINIFKNNIQYTIITNASLIDLSDEYLLYNNDNNLYLYDLNNKSELMVASNAYNGVIGENYIIYESDIDDNYKCKNLVGNFQIRNCYKLYIYNFVNNDRKILLFDDNDNYLNDYENNILIFSSVHGRDNICNSLCSYINIYDLSKKELFVINKYNEVELAMSGNGIIDDNIVYFESVVNVYECDYSQIFAYDLKDNSIIMITKNANNCFNYNSELVDASNGYLIFRTRYGNYDNNEDMNYLYSKEDFKYKVIEGDCKYKKSLIIKNTSLIYVENNKLKYYSFDNDPPYLKNNYYTALKDNKEKLISNLDYDDDLSSKENISVEINDDLTIVGERLVTIYLCDKLSNCANYEVLINVVSEDTVAPLIYCQESIIVKIGETIMINDYGYGYDEIDGKRQLEIVSEIDYSKKGTFKVLIKCEDLSGNISYKEIEIIIYDDLNLNILYIISIGVSLLLILIIYIFRFKKSH